MLVWVFIDDSGDGGLKFSSGSSSHLVMAACIFRDPKQIEHLAECVQQCREKNRHRTEFKYSKTREGVRDCFFECTESVDYAIRTIFMDKAKLHSPKLRSSPSAMKSYAIRMLLTKNYGFIQGAKVIIDGEDTKAFGIEDSAYLMRMVNQASPGTIGSVKFDDSKVNVGIQLADMAAGAINRGVRTHKTSDWKHLALIRPRMYQHRGGTLWDFTRAP